MQRSVRVSLALLALVVLTVGPVLAAELEHPEAATQTTAETTAAAPEVPALDAQLEKPTAQTPAPSPDDIERQANPDKDLFFEAISACDERLHCPSADCACLIIRNQVNCFC
jgi:hypothetical protein